MMSQPETLNPTALPTAQALDLMPTAAYATDARGVIVHYNRLAAELWGFAPAHGSPAERFCVAAALFRPDGSPLPHDQSPVAHVLRDGVPRADQEVIAQRPDGSRVWLSMDAAPVRDAAARVAGAVCCFRDISTRKSIESAFHAAAALHAGQRRVLELLATGTDLEPVLAALVETIEAQSPGMVCAILLVDPADASRLIFGTARTVPQSYRAAFSHFAIVPDRGTCGVAAFHRRLHVTPDIAADPHWADLRHVPLACGLRAAWAVPIVAGTGKLLGTFGSYFREAREPTPAEVRLVEDAAHLAGVAIEQHRAQQELRAAKDAAIAARETAEAASRAKDDFLAALSHELRTPLSPVLLTASALAHDPTLPSALRDDVELIQRSVELEARLIDDLLDLTRITRGKLQLHPETVDAHALLRQAVHTCCGSDVDNKSLHIDLQLAAANHTLVADPARLQQVFWNLIKNAVKFTPAGGHLTVITRDAQAPGVPAGGEFDPRLVIEVHDTGIGIDPDALPTIFNAFQQADGTIGKRFGGLGLGLAICKSLVDLHGGTIHAASAGAGHGSTFTLELPAVPARVLSRPEYGPAPAAPRGLNILLVEDHDTTLKVLTKLLHRMEHHVVPAATCKDALTAAARDGRRFDVLISDIGLPDGTGHQLLRHLRAHQPAMKSIALSGFGMDHDIRKSLDAGFHTHLVKPVHFEKLKGAIAQLFA